MFKHLIANKHGGTAIFMTMVILSAILVVSLSASHLIMNGMKYNRGRYDSAKAYYAAETGAEQIMWGIRKGGIGLIPLTGGYCPDPGDFCFDASGDILECVANAAPCTGTNIESHIMTNEAEYAIEFDLDRYIPDTSKSSTTLVSTGIYKNEVRKIKLTYRSGE